MPAAVQRMSVSRVVDMPLTIPLLSGRPIWILMHWSSSSSWEKTGSSWTFAVRGGDGRPLRRVAHAVVTAGEPTPAGRSAERARRHGRPAHRRSGPGWSPHSPDGRQRPSSTRRYSFQPSSLATATPAVVRLVLFSACTQPLGVICSVFSRSSVW
jgi:hypothetical protein